MPCKTVYLENSICLASSGRNAFEFTLSPSRGVAPSGDAGPSCPPSSVSKMLNKYRKPKNRVWDSKPTHPTKISCAT